MKSGAPPGLIRLNRYSGKSAGRQRTWKRSTIPPCLRLKVTGMSSPGPLANVAANVPARGGRPGTLALQPLLPSIRSRNPSSAQRAA